MLYTGKALAGQLGVSAYPTLIIVDSKGKGDLCRSRVQQGADRKNHSKPAATWRTRSTVTENSPELKMLQLVNVLNDEWQCVIRESRYFHKEDQKYHFITYFVGQSKDGGETWRSRTLLSSPRNRS